MRKFYSGVVKSRKFILIAFIAAAIICAGLKGMVAINYDMNDYLPEDAASTIALDVMSDEFDGGIPNARVMIKNVTIPEALAYKAKIEAVSGVTDVTWLDDAADIRVPMSHLDKDTVENYYKDQAALYSVTIEEDNRDAVESRHSLLYG